MNKKILLSTSLVLLLTPLIGLAGVFDVGTITQPDLWNAWPAGWNPVNDPINNIFNFLIWPLVVTVIIVLFIMAGITFLTAAGEPGKIETAKKYLIWGIVGVMIAILAFSIIATVRWLLGL